jgi:hypothetical protein
VTQTERRAPPAHRLPCHAVRSVPRRRIRAGRDLPRNRGVARRCHPVPRCPLALWSLGVQVVAGSNPVAPTPEARRIARKPAELRASFFRFEFAPHMRPTGKVRRTRPRLFRAAPNESTRSSVSRSSSSSLWSYVPAVISASPTGPDSRPPRAYVRIPGAVEHANDARAEVVRAVRPELGPVLLSVEEDVRLLSGGIVLRLRRRARGDHPTPVTHEQARARAAQGPVAVVRGSNPLRRVTSSSAAGRASPREALHASPQTSLRSPPSSSRSRGRSRSRDRRCSVSGTPR